MPNPPASVATGKNFVRLDNFSKGENRKSDGYDLPAGWLKACRNWYLSDDGSLNVRRGTLRFNPVSIGAGATRGSVRVYPTKGTAPFFVAAHGTKVVHDRAVAGTFADAMTGLSATASWWFTQVGRFVYSSNGVDAHKKLGTDTGSFVSWGIAAPVTGPTAAEGAAGALSGTYTFKVTYVLASGAESNGGSASNSVIVVSKKINLTAIPVSGDSGVTKRKIYGFKSAVSSVYQLVATLDDNTTTTYEVVADQDAWTTTLPTDNDPPPAKAWISAYHKNRVWLAGDVDNPTRLYFSKVGVPETALEAFPLENFLTVSMDVGDEITGLLPVGDVLYVFGNESVFYVAGSTELTFAPYRTYATAGMPGPWAADRVQILGSEDVAIYLSRNGVQVLNGLQAVVVSEAEEPLFSDLPASAVGRMNYAYAGKATVKFYDKLKAVVISFPVGSGQINNFMLWYFLGKGFVEDSRAARQFLVLTTYDNDGKMYAWDANAGILREVDVGQVYTDDGVAIEAELDTGYVSGGQYVQELTKIWQWLTIVTDADAVTADVIAAVDEFDDVEQFTFQTNVDERFGGEMRGRRLRLVMTFATSVFFSLTQLAVRFTQTKAFRPRG